MLVRLPSTNIMGISREREEKRVTSRRDKPAGDIMLVRLPSTNIMVISRERVTSRRDKQAGDIMLVRLPSNIMVISRERERRRMTS